MNRALNFVAAGSLRKLLRQQVRVAGKVQKPQLRVTPDLVESLLRDYAAGDTVYELMARYGVHRNSISKALRSAGGAMRREAMSEAERAQARKLHAAGLSLNAIVLAIGRDPKTVKGALV